MFRKNKSKLSVLLALGSLYTFGGAVDAKENLDYFHIVQKNESNDIKDQEQNLMNEINNVGQARYKSVVECRDFEPKFKDIYKNKSSENEVEYNKAFEEGRSLVSECIDLTEKFESLLEEYLRDFKDYCNSSVELRAKYIGLSDILHTVYCDYGYLCRWKGFADGKFDKPPILYINMWKSIKWFQHVDSLCGLDTASLENVATNFDYIYDGINKYYIDVKLDKQKFDPSKWNSMMIDIDKSIDCLVELHSKHLDAYQKLHDSIDSDEKSKDLLQDDFFKKYYDSTSQLKDDLLNLIQNRKISVKKLNNLKDRVSKDKNATSLPDSMKEF